MEDKGRTFFTPIDGKGKGLLHDQANTSRDAWKFGDEDIFSFDLPPTVHPTQLPMEHSQQHHVSLQTSHASTHLSEGCLPSSSLLQSDNNISQSPHYINALASDPHVSSLSITTPNTTHLGLESSMMIEQYSASVTPTDSGTLLQTSYNGTEQLLFSFMPTPTTSLSFSSSSSCQLVPNHCITSNIPRRENLALGPIFPIVKNHMFPHNNTSDQASTHLPFTDLYKTSIIMASASPDQVTPCDRRALIPSLASDDLRSPYGSLLYQHQTLLPPPTSCYLSRSNYQRSSNYQYAYENRLELSNSKPSAYMDELRSPVREFGRRVYRCSTCSSEFPNAQAFGGHMSSHSKSRKTKAASVESTPPDSKRLKNSPLSLQKSKEAPPSKGSGQEMVKQVTKRLTKWLE